MKSHRSFLSILSICSVLLAACNPSASIPSSRLESATATEPPAGPRQAWLSEIQNEVFWQPEEQPDWQIATLDLPLATGYRVSTGAQGRAAVTFSEGTLARLTPNTLFVLHNLAGTTAEPQTLLELLTGELFILLDGVTGAGSFEVETISGTASVRGTWLGVRLNSLGQLFATCLEGMCNLANSAGTVQFTSGEQAQILTAESPPAPPAPMESYQLNAWFQNVPGAVNIAVEQGLLDEQDLPDGCDPANGAGCEIELDCDPLTGAGCELPDGCELETGENCALPSGCNLISGAGCDLLPGCNPETGEGCAMPFGCNPVTGVGCTLGAFCDSSVYPECALLENCNFITGEGCVLFGCNIVTLEGCAVPPGVEP